MPGLPRCLLPGEHPPLWEEAPLGTGNGVKTAPPLVEPTGTSEAHFPKDLTGSAWALHKPHVMGSCGIIQT